MTNFNVKKVLVGGLIALSCASVTVSAASVSLSVSQSISQSLTASSSAALSRSVNQFISAVQAAETAGIAITAMNQSVADTLVSNLATNNREGRQALDKMTAKIRMIMAEKSIQTEAQAKSMEKTKQDRVNLVLKFAAVIGQLNEASQAANNMFSGQALEALDGVKGNSEIDDNKVAIDNFEAIADQFLANPTSTPVAQLDKITRSVLGEENGIQTVSQACNTGRR